MPERTIDCGEPDGAMDDPASDCADAALAAGMPFVLRREVPGIESRGGEVAWFSPGRGLVIILSDLAEDCDAGSCDETTCTTVVRRVDCHDPRLTRSTFILFECSSSDEQTVCGPE